MNAEPIYLLDANIFITAKNTYYAFDICPGFWGSLLDMYEKKSVFSIDRVRQELLMGRETEDLVQWVKTQVPAGFFFDIDSAVSDQYGKVMFWAQRHSQFSDAAKAKFASGADGWLVAHACVHGSIVVTNEQPAPMSKGAIKLPDVCQAFNVPFKSVFEVLRELNVKFVY